MKFHASLLASFLLISMSVRADDWSKRDTDEFDVNMEEMKVEEPKAPIPQVEEVLPEMPVVQEIQEPEPEKPKKESGPLVKKYKNLKSTPVHLVSGAAVNFNKIVVFTCENIPGKPFLFNKKQTDYCWMKDSKDAAQIAKKIGVDYFKKNAAVFEVCATEMTLKKSCNPKVLRNF